MTDETALDLALLVFRLALGGVLLAHGINHLKGGGKIEGTGRWFASMGMRPGIVHAWLATLAELGAGVSLVLGLVVPFGAAGLLGVMVVAFVIHHRKNGFFIFRPGEGYEYVMVLAACAPVVAGTGGGEWSFDAALDLALTGSTGLAICLLGGLGGAALTLAAGWRPPARPAAGSG